MRTSRRSRAIAFRPMLLTLALIAFAVPAAASRRGHSEKRPTGPAVIAYVFPRDHVIQPGEIAARKLSRINYAFANIQDGRIVIVNPADAPNLATLIALKQENPSLQILISVGGWLWSGNFSDVALTWKAGPASSLAWWTSWNNTNSMAWTSTGSFRARLVRATDSVPRTGGNYTLLLAGIRKRFDSEEQKLGRPLLLSIAAGANG